MGKRFSIHRNKEAIFSMGFSNKMPEESALRRVKNDVLTAITFQLIGFRIGLPLLKNRTIYLPASRSGIMLLYANYLSNDNNSVGNEKSTDEDIVYDNNYSESENEYGLTEPVYDFLMFLLKHKNSELNSNRNKEIITFIEKNIINGSLERVGNTMRYKPDSSEESIPIYLSSSLVSEISPIYQVLTGIQRYEYILYDEIETCQHPTKQIELARLLVRMVNAGYKMIVSTHSDTMALTINNLLTLSFKDKREELVDRLDYEEADMLQSAKVKAYQFLVEDGRTRVVEIPNHLSVGIGFDFDLFNYTNDRIYQDALTISEVD